jgi:hypothetical protein
VIDEYGREEDVVAAELLVVPLHATGKPLSTGSALGGLEK